MAKRATKRTVAETQRDKDTVAEASSRPKTVTAKGKLGTPKPVRKASKSRQSAQDSGAETVEELRQELDRAHQRIADLEQRQTEVLNRIDWVLDSLKTAAAPTVRRRSE